ncbi:MAG: hypothetical protein IPH05_14890 [Flavobacteriales bacterium]|nr:hypothetical protein [Flavobacteriales bacterium]
MHRLLDADDIRSFHLFTQHTNQFRASAVLVVYDARSPVPAFTSGIQSSLGIRIETSTQGEEILDALWSFAHHHFHYVRITTSGTHGQRIVTMLFPGIGGIHDCSNATLRRMRIARFRRGLGKDPDIHFIFPGQYGEAMREGHASHAAPNNDHVQAPIHPSCIMRRRAVSAR